MFEVNDGAYTCNGETRAYSGERQSAAYYLNLCCHLSSARTVAGDIYIDYGITFNGMGSPACAAVQESWLNHTYANVYHVDAISKITTMHKEELHYSFFALPFSSPPASHSRENKRNPMLVLTAPV